jgi:hypothetical protein
MDLSPDEPWEPQPYDRRRHLARLAATPMVQAQRLFLQGAERALGATDPFRAAGDLRKATELVAELARNRPQAPATFLNRGIGPNRRYARVRAPLDTLKANAKAAGGTVNDAILAAVAGMLARLFEQAGERPSRAPVALVPGSVRRAGGPGARPSRSSRSACGGPARRAATASRPCSSTCRRSARRRPPGSPRCTPR